MASKRLVLIQKQKSPPLDTLQYSFIHFWESQQNTTFKCLQKLAQRTPKFFNLWLSGGVQPSQKYASWRPWNLQKRTGHRINSAILATIQSLKNIINLRFLAPFWSTKHYLPFKADFLNVSIHWNFFQRIFAPSFSNFGPTMCFWHLTPWKWSNKNTQGLFQVLKHHQKNTCIYIHIYICMYKIYIYIYHWHSKHQITSTPWHSPFSRIQPLERCFHLRIGKPLSCVSTSNPLVLKSCCDIAIPSGCVDPH